MELLKNQFNFEGWKRRKESWIFGQDDHYDEHDDHDEHHEDDHDQYQDNVHDEHNLGNHSQAYPANPVMPSTELICTHCSTQLVQGAKFCHQCGITIELKANCASCGSTLSANALFCPQCGDKNG
jgi:hypothetical protein